MANPLSDICHSVYFNAVLFYITAIDGHCIAEGRKYRALAARSLVFCANQIQKPKRLFKMHLMQGIQYSHVSQVDKVGQSVKACKTSTDESMESHERITAASRY